MTRTARLLPVLLSAAFLLLGIAWLAGPPGSGPDEPAHYLRALSIGRGDLFSEPTAQGAMRPQNAAQAERQRQTTRSVEVTAR